MHRLYGISMVLRKTKRSLHGLLQLSTLCSSFQNPRPGIASVNYSKILSYHFRVGRVEDAEKLFEEIPEKNVVSWSIVIHGYAKNGFHRESLGSFSRMRVSGVAPNSFTMVGVLVAVVGLRKLGLGRCVHGMTVKIGLESDSIVGTAMLDAYARCGDIVDCCKLFEGLENPGLVSWNAVLAGLVGNGLFEEGVLLFNKFRQSDLVPSAVTVLTLIQGCVSLESWKHCESIHGLIVKCSLALEISINNSVLYMYSSFMDLDAAIKIFDGMETKDVISWTTLMGLFVRLEHAFDAINLFCEMRENGFRFDGVAIMNIISACAMLGDLKIGRQIHAQAIICGFRSELCLTNSFIAMYSNCGDFGSSRILFDQTTEKSLVSWTAMISGCVQCGRPKEALNLLNRARAEENFYLDPIMMVIALTASGELATLELCQKLHCYALKAGFPQYRLVQNSLITTYSRCGNAELGCRVFKEMGVLRDRVSWNAIISGCGINGHGETAVTIFHEMRKCGKDPDSATYSSILSACSHSALVNDGLMIFSQMVEENRIRPSKEHVGCVVDLLARSGCLLDPTSKFLELLDPNGWRALLSGCLLYGNVGLAELAARRVFELDLEEPGQVALLSNVYASVGRFLDAEVLRSGMKKKRLVKNPGISLINGLSYDFG
ncbi:pentatricopeptide repeat-containing protein At4g35130, chloroplastic-like [Malania oleifera]|uniref:pentatricopeptide repeat-containing protein At4g35130, chloroplastic-like n=1 Tax=Malania oleifera TaxID=397392 RepID=UPI0025AE5CB4|nr:pentatricopeptide repeat-containing protein At4g35130, chloroplastic-like [Malania oleifera]